MTGLPGADPELLGPGAPAQGVPGGPGAAPPGRVPAGPEDDGTPFPLKLAGLPRPGPLEVMPGWMTSLPPVSTEELTWTSAERSGGTAMATAVTDTSIARPAVVVSATRPLVWKASRSEGIRLGQGTESLKLVSFLSLLRLVSSLKPMKPMKAMRPMRRVRPSSQDAPRRAIALSRQ